MRPLTDDEAWILSHNLPLVQSCLKGRRHTNATWEDLRAAGYLGLCHAIQHYDPEFGAFSTYAKKWILKFVLREKHNLALLHIPEYHYSKSQSPKVNAIKQRTGDKAQKAMAAHTIPFQDVQEELPEKPQEEPVIELTEQDKQELETYVCELTEDQQKIIRRVVMEGERLIDVANEAHVNRQTVASVKRRALDKLRLLLREARPDWAYPNGKETPC